MCKYYAVLYKGHEHPQILVQRDDCTTDWWLINNRNLLLAVWRLQVWDQDASLVEWGSFSRSQTSPWILTWQKGQGSSLRPLLRALIPFLRTLPSWPNPLPKAPPPNTIILEIRFSTYEFWGDIYIQTIVTMQWILAPWALLVYIFF